MGFVIFMTTQPSENWSKDIGAKPLIVTQNLSVRYGAAMAVDSVSLEIPEGMATAFIGPSGCGKSTLLRCFNRMNDSIDRVKITGKVAIAGHDIYRRQVNAAELRKKVGMVFQKPNPFPKSIRSNVAYGPKLHGLRDREMLAEIVEASLKAAAPVKRMGVTAPDARLTANSPPVKIPGKARGKTTLATVCKRVAPKAMLASRRPVDRARRLSSTAVDTAGNVKIAIVRDAQSKPGCPQ